MDVVTLFRLLCRRKRIVIPALLLATGSLVAAYKLSPVDYQASGSTVFLNPPAAPTNTRPPTTPTSLSADNPYLRFGDPSVVLDILVRTMQTDAVGRSLKSQGFNGTYTVGANIAYYHGPILDVTVQAHTARNAISGVDLIMNEVGRQLALQQSKFGTDPTYFIKAETVVNPDKATTVLSSTLRRLIALGVLDLIGVLALALLAEALANQRARRNEAAENSNASEPLPPSSRESPTGPSLGGVVADRRHRPDGPDRTGQPVKDSTGQPVRLTRSSRRNRVSAPLRTLSAPIRQAGHGTSNPDPPLP